MSMISIEQQFAEKIHAYTLPRVQRPNSRVKYFVDMQLLIGIRTFDLHKLRVDLRKVFKFRNTHSLPIHIPSPPIEWVEPYAELAEKCGIESNLILAFQNVSEFYSNIGDV